MKIDGLPAVIANNKSMKLKKPAPGVVVERLGGSNIAGEHLHRF